MQEWGHGQVRGGGEGGPGGFAEIHGSAFYRLEAGRLEYPFCARHMTHLQGASIAWCVGQLNVYVAYCLLAAKICKRLLYSR